MLLCLWFFVTWYEYVLLLINFMNIKNSAFFVINHNLTIIVYISSFALNWLNHLVGTKWLLLPPHIYIHNYVIWWPSTSTTYVSPFYKHFLCRVIEFSSLGLRACVESITNILSGYLVYSFFKLLYKIQTFFFDSVSSFIRIWT